MKTTLIYFLLIIPGHLLAQDHETANKAVGYFEKSRLKYLSMDSMAYHVWSVQKTLFKTDTNINSASVILKKRGSALDFFRIMEDSSGHELLFCQDTLWSVDHGIRTRFFMGRGLNDLQGTALSSFLLDFLFQLSTPPSRDNVSWDIKEIKGNRLTLILKLKPTPDFSDITVNLQIDTAEFFVFNESLTATFRNMETQYQGKIVDRHSFPEALSLKEPAYFHEYIRVFPKSGGGDVQLAGGNQEQFMGEFNLTTLSGESFILPTEGLIFLDFWYVGCLPCLKAAPVIEKLHGEFGDRVSFFGINEVDKERSAVQSFIQKMGIDFPVLMSKNRLVEKATLSKGYPGFVLLEAKTGKIIWFQSGFSGDLEQQIRKAFSNVLASGH